MMDPRPTFPNMYHPSRNRRNLNFKGSAKYYTRTARPTKYFLVDFGLSRKYNPEDGEPREIPIKGGDKTVPEFQGRGEFRPCNPFPTDIYYLGNMIREDFLQQTRGVEFMEPLVNDMVQDDPLKRPNIDEVVRRFEEITRKLSSWKLRSRLVVLEEKEYPVVMVLRTIHHFFRTFAHVLMFRNPLPRPRV
ncbi:hypothetical protein NLI96_g7318 [Meripilus lineatus]|uniref:Protein kinase domain-containing protein n=1 Tax=Meripilus lineatus TaxID=2056292 RepID=A0AAD5UZD5_9APHY|nr:hypothetical protein NLI96_g7318 [Physisporinus lineatus]